jgi:hypothetical protein
MFNRFRPPRIFLGRNPAINAIPEGIQNLMDAFRPTPLEPLQGGSGYVLLTRKSDEDDTYLGRKLEFDVNNRNLGFALGKPEQVLLDGHPIFETQIRFASKRKLRERFFDEFHIESLTHAQVADVLADADDDPEMFGQTAAMDAAIENEMDELRAEMEAEYLDRFEEDYQERFDQEYPGRFSQDFEKHYNDLVQDELNDSVESHEDLYTEYIVTPKYIRYKR